MNQLLHSIWMERLGWALLHSLWQGALLWILSSLVLVSLRGLRAARRHKLACVFLVLFVFCPVLTTTWLTAGAGPATRQSSATTVMAAEKPSVIIPSTVAAASAGEHRAASIIPAEIGESERPMLQRAIPWIALLWMTGVFFLGLRLVFGLAWLTSLKRSATSLSPEATGMLRALCERYFLAIPRIHEVPRLGIPIIMGWLRPAICLPASLCSGLTTAEVESILLHEMAHLKRRDPFWQFVITAIETLLFYHPTAHALARQARESAEEACDGMVVSWTRDEHAYARALATLEEARGAQLLIAASGSPLRRRLRRILGQPMAPQTPLRFGFTGIAGVAVFLLFSFLGVPRLAQALTHEERRAAVAKMRSEWGGDGGQEGEEKFVAIGQAHFPLGSTPPTSFPLQAFSGNHDHRMTAEGVTGIRIEGQGDSMQVLAWPKGFAPARTQTSKRNPETHEATFDLHFEVGFPAVLQFADEKGRPVEGAKVSLRMAFADGGPCILANHGNQITTDAEGKVSPGHVTAVHRFGGYVLAHGFAWQTFHGLACDPQHPTTIQLMPASAIRGEVVAEATGKPVAGCHVHCGYIQHQQNTYSFGGGPENMPAMARSPSDSEGHVIVDICGAGDQGMLVFYADGYRPMSLAFNEGTRTFRMALRPTIVVEGVIRDPDQLLEYHDGKVTLSFGHSLAPGGKSWDHKALSGDPSGIPFRFDHLAVGKVSFEFGERKWSAMVEKSMTGMELIVQKDRLLLKGEPEPDPSANPHPPRRTLEMVFDLPPGAPPLEGKVSLSTYKESPSVTITKGRARWDARISKEVVIRPRSVVGWAFIEKTVKIEPGAGSQVVHLSCLPAGAVSGQVDTSSKPDRFSGFYLGLLTCQPARYPDGTSWISPLRWGMIETAQRSNHFFGSPIPLGGTYKVVAVSGSCIAESPEIVLDEAHPVREQNLKFVGDSTLDGALLPPNATPPDGMTFYVLYREGGLTFPGAVYAVAGGQFHLTDMDFHLPGSYALYVPGGPGHAPQEVPITANSSNVKIQLQPGLPLEVLLLDEKNQPVSDVQLVACPGTSERDSEEHWHQEMRADGPSDAKGRVHFSCFAAGSHLIRMNRVNGWSLVEDKPEAVDSTVVKLPYSGTGPLRLRLKRDISE